ncbi:hypothetical protein BON22_2002 [Cyberlindnera fabianii]|uniref:Histone-lysine N-methyltransferase, H3 lysine-36 specific n=1 Tax=Cyberlindnera fabianii TaxID=36022 RepID=A0A1V2L865_CYBFA|nr:hypothetical protein BON22_2002 [Cyberlindnera fabianii]
MSDSEDGYSPILRDASEESEPQLTAQEQLASEQRQQRRVEQRNVVPDKLQLYAHLPDATAEAESKFTVLDECTYQYKYIGHSGQRELMTCVCEEERREDGSNAACTDDDCINRGTRIECVNGAPGASCGDDCGNQRFQRHDYANISVFQTDKKGYGVRAEQDLEPDTFVWEYIGEVIDEKTFRKRMVNYDQQGVKHFYFMMLQKGEFIDATEKGSLARFLNHSCNPNCYVEKWVVGEKLKMGIFTKRRIVKGEELTFNYNVDRYGATAQACFCGEPNCIGVIGGKTQTTAVSLLPQLISDALGSSVEQEQVFLKLMKADGEKTEDLTPLYLQQLELRPILGDECPTVAAGLSQVEDPLIASKIIERIEMSSVGISQLIKKYRGFEAFERLIRYSFDRSHINSFDVDDNLVIQMLQIMLRWRVTSSWASEPKVIAFFEDLKKHKDNIELLSLADELKKKWDAVEEYKKIRKSSNQKRSEYANIRKKHEDESNATTTQEGNGTEDIWREESWPFGWFATKDPSGKVYYFNQATGEVQWDVPEIKVTDEEKLEREKTRIKQRKEAELNARKLELELKKQKENAVNSVIEQAKLEYQEALATAKEKEEQELKRLKRKEEQKKRLASSSSASASPAGHRSSSATPSGSQPLSETEFRSRWKKHFAEHVPNMLKKYSDTLGRDTIKECARDIVQILVGKEWKKDSTKKPPREFTPDRHKKLKSFVDLYMEKVVAKYNEKKRRAEERDEGRKKQHTKSSS